MRGKMKRWAAVTTCLLITILTLFTMPLPVYAYSPEIYSIDIYISLNQDGSADVTETWNVQVADGTEWYLVQGNLGEIEIQDLSVTDETGTVYENEGDWDVDRSIDEKAGKCGIVDKGNGSYELCWGVGSYGDHVYTVNYHMTNFMKGFDDYCAFNQRVINDELSSNPQQISVTVTKPGTEFTTDDVGVWAFGFDGTIYVENGVVSATSNESLGSNDYVTVMCRFPREMFDTSDIVNGSFEEMKETAFEGSDYSSDDFEGGLACYIVCSFIAMIISTIVIVTLSAKKNNLVTTFEDARERMKYQKSVKFYAKPVFWIIMIISLVMNPLFPIFVFIWVLVSSRNDGDEVSKDLIGTAYPLGYIRKELTGEIGYSRDVPFECNIAVISAAGRMTALALGNNNVIGAYLLKWLQAGDIEIRNVRKAGSNKEAPSVVLSNIPSNMESHVESQLFSMLNDAGGSDHILQETEMYKWSRKNYTKVNEVMKGIEDEGKRYLTEHEMLGKIPSGGILGLSFIPQDAFTESGREGVIHLCKFRNFLKDFTLINERVPQEVTLWDQYLIVAQIFGLADEVAKQFKKIYPDYFTEHATYYSDYGRSFVVINAISNAGISGASSASSGGGGSSSGGGGGGASGGGSGGGSR